MVQSLPRVLLVEDDPAIARFVELATADLPLQLEVEPTVALALANLRREPAALIITDLMLGGESGLVLLQALQEQPRWRGGARLVVFSAGVSEPVRRSLDLLDVWRVLRKPAPLAELRQCIEQGLADSPRQAGWPAAAPESPAGAAAGSAREEALRRFGGDVQLFETYRASCLLQFGADLRGGEQAAQAADQSALRLLGHSLKSVLRLIGEPVAADAAAQLEWAATAGDMAATLAAWRGLCPHLQALAPAP